MSELSVTEATALLLEQIASEELLVIRTTDQRRVLREFARRLRAISTPPAIVEVATATALPCVEPGPKPVTDRGAVGYEEGALRSVLVDKHALERLAEQGSCATTLYVDPVKHRDRYARLYASPPSASKSAPFQARVHPWMLACFGSEIAGDKLERGDRFLEEAFELLQSGGYTFARALALAEYVFSRPKGEPEQEVGGVMVTLAAYCSAHGIDMHAAGDKELARIWTKIAEIRAKQAAKPRGSALPVALIDPARDKGLMPNSNLPRTEPFCWSLPPWARDDAGLKAWSQALRDLAAAVEADKTPLDSCYSTGIVQALKSLADIKALPSDLQQSTPLNTSCPETQWS